MEESDRDKLVKILRMFGSDHDGEVAAAARRAHSLLTARALDWDDLLVQRGNNQAPPPLNDDDEADLIRHCTAHERYLTQWEKEFIASIGVSLVEWGSLTPKQRSVLDRITRKLAMAGL